MTAARRRALLLLGLTGPLFAWGVGRARLVAFDGRWPASSAGTTGAPSAEERAPIDQAVSVLRTADAELRRRLEDIATDLAPHVAAARDGKTDEALRAVMAASPPVSPPELLEVRGRGGRLLAWAGYAPSSWAAAAPRGPPGADVPADGPAVTFLDAVPPALVARLTRTVAGQRVELALFAPLREILGAGEGELAIDLRRVGAAAPLDAEPPPGLLTAELDASSGERWLVSAPRASRVVAREQLEHEARLVTMLAIVALVLVALGLLGRRLVRSPAPVGSRLAQWTLAVAALALGYHAFESQTGWLAMLPDALDGEQFYADADHRLGHFTQSPLALLLSTLALLGWLLGCRRIAATAAGEALQPRSLAARGLAAVVCVALSLGLLALVALQIRSVVRFSYDVDLFPDDRVVPAGAALVLELALLLGALFVLLGSDTLIGLALRALRGVVPPMAARPALLGLALLLGLPWLPATCGWSLALTAYLIALTAFTAALHRGLREYGELARALVVLLGAGALLFPALSRQLRTEQFDVARGRVESFDRDEAATLLSVRVQSVLTDMGHAIAGAPADWPEQEATAFRLWQTHRESLGPRALIRVLDTETKIVSRFEIGMPPPDWYFAELDGLQDRPDQEWATRFRLRRGRFELSLVAQVMTVEHHGRRWRLLLAMPLVDDPLLPGDADPGMRLPGPLPGVDSRGHELLLRREVSGWLRCPLPVGALELPTLAPGEVAQVRRQVAGATTELFCRGEEGGALVAVGVRQPDAETLFVDYVRLLLILVVGAAALWLPLVALRRLRRRGALGLAIERRLLAAFGLLSILPLLWLAAFSARRGTAAIEQTVRAQLAGDLGQLRALVVDRLDAASGDLDVALHSVDGALAAARRQGMTLLVYRRGTLVADNRPGMVRIGALPVRPPAHVERDLIGRRADRSYDILRRDGDAPLPLIYGALTDPATGAPMAILATVSRARPDALLREQARTTRVAVAVYGLALLAVMLLGMVIARRISRPVEALLEGTRQIGAGNLEHQIVYPARDEFGELVDSFNAMTSQVRLLQEQRVDAGRSEVMSTMARQIAHEIKNPLTPMKLSAQHLRDAHERGHERFSEILAKTTRTIEEQVDALHRIASAFSTYGSFPDRELQPVDIEAMLEEVARMYDGYEDRIEVIRRFAGGLEPVRADRDELRRVFINLATNAVQAIDGPGRLVLVTGRSLLEPIDSRGERAGEPRPCVEAKLIDTGAGISQENLEKIFVPNFSTKTSGTGLGLPICRKAVHAYGGSISIASRLGEGTTVSVSLPIATSEEQPA